MTGEALRRKEIITAMDKIERYLAELQIALKTGNSTRMVEVAMMIRRQAQVLDYQATSLEDEQRFAH